MSQLKYEHIQPNTVIKAYDFQNRPDVDERYICGMVERHEVRHGVKFLVVRCTWDSMVRNTDDPTRAGRANELVYVPMETDSDEDWHHDRVVVL